MEQRLFMMRCPETSNENFMHYDVRVRIIVISFALIQQ